jgi:hypothetical protein
MPGLDGARPGARKVNLAEFDEVRVRRLHHVHDLSPFVYDLPERDDFNAVNHNINFC